MVAERVGRQVKEAGGVRTKCLFFVSFLLFIGSSRSPGPFLALQQPWCAMKKVGSKQCVCVWGRKEVAEKLLSCPLCFSAFLCYLGIRDRSVAW